jgi:hypothetical protein
VRCSEQCERWGGCFMSEDSCLCVNWRGRKNTADMHSWLTQFPSPSLWHTVDLQHYIICMGFELDCTALVNEGTEFIQNSNHIAQCHIAESEGTKFLHNTQYIAQCHIPDHEGTKFLQQTNHIAQCYIAEGEGTRFVHNTNQIAQCHIPEDEGTNFLQNTNQMAQCYIQKGANPLNPMC